MNEKQSGKAKLVIQSAYEAGEAVFVSPISAWEVGLLVARGRLRIVADLVPLKYRELHLIGEDLDWVERIHKDGLGDRGTVPEGKELVGECHDL